MKKILIIEDDPIVAHIYKSRLEKEDYEVEVAADGQSGFYRIHEFHPEAVLLDLMLPKMNGVEILKKIRAQPQFQHIPIIVFTNAYVPNMIHEAFQAGATQVFNKATLTPRQILDALHNAIAFQGSPGASRPGGAPKSGGPGAGAASTAKIDRCETFGDPAYHDSPAGSAGSRPADFATSSAAQAATAVLAPPAPQRADDAEVQAELVRTFQDSAPELIQSLRKSMQEFAKAQEDSSRLAPLLELYRKIHALTGSAGLAGRHNVSQMAAALEVLLKELHEKPKNINASTLRTVAHSIDFIAELVQKSSEENLLEAHPVNILVVDDEILSRRAVTYALEKAGLNSVSVEDAPAALNLATEKTFDLIFLDVQMPGMDGFDLCTKIRALPTNKTTPIIFVTSLTDFKSRARSTLSGGADLIAKPFMFIELSVKALTYVLRGRLGKKA